MYVWLKTEYGLSQIYYCLFLSVRIMSPLGQIHNVLNFWTNTACFFPVARDVQTYYTELYASANEGVNKYDLLLNERDLR